MADYDQLNKIARRQFGLATTEQLTTCGFSRHAIRRMAKAGKLVRVRRGVYRVCGSPPSWRASALAAVLAAGDDAVLSHRSAAALWGLIDHHGLETLDITGVRSRQAGVRSHLLALADGERTKREGVPVTTAARTLADLAEVYGVVELGKLVDEALRRGITNLEEFRSAALRTGRARRVARATRTLTTVLADRGVGYDPGANDWEREMDNQWEVWGLPPAKRQHRIRVGDRTYRPDRVIVELRICVEWNGRKHHGTRTGFESDSNRRNHLQRAGWRVLDFHYRTDPALIVSTVLAVCDEQRQLLATRGIT